MYNNVVQEFDVEKLARIPYSKGEFDVITAGVQVPRRVVVTQYQPSSSQIQCFPYNPLNIHDRSVQTSGPHALSMQDTRRDIKVDCPKLLMPHISQPTLHQFNDILHTANFHFFFY